MTKDKTRISFKTALEILLVSLKLGLTSFGGPIAHLGYFHNEYVGNKKWIDERSYADLVALCQFLPGPASSQVGIGIGVMRAGLAGGILAFIGFTLPSVIGLMLFASLFLGMDAAAVTWVKGLKIVAVVVVAHAVLGMAQKLTPDLQRKTIALGAIAATLLIQTTLIQVLVIVLAGLAGYLIYKQCPEDQKSKMQFPVSRHFGYACLALFFGLLITLPILRGLTGDKWIAMFDSFYRSGSLVFGGGHVVLPLLEREFVTGGWLSGEAFLAGYGATQAVPGPLFTFASYLGTIITGWQGGLLATAAIFLPAFLLILGTIPFWDSLRLNPKVRGAMMGINAAVVGILISALYHPIWTSAILEPLDFVIAAILFSMLVFWKLPPWVIVIVGAVSTPLMMLIK